MSKKEEDFIENLNLSRDISSEFVIAEKIIRTSAKGRKYIDITLVDRTGQMDGRIFPNPIEVDSVHASINLGSVCRIMGRISEFPIDSGKFNMVINVFTELEDNEYQLEDFVMSSDNNTDELVDEIRRTIEDMKNPQLKNLLKSFFCDKNFTELFYKSPAAIVHHHNYVGGLLDHTVEVLKITRIACDIFPDLKQDLLYCGVLLHDIGKITTYTFGNGPISISEEGELLDHIYISCEMVKEKMEKLDTPKELSNQILHMILSHHGPVSLGWGSSIDPENTRSQNSPLRRRYGC